MKAMLQPVATYRAFELCGTLLHIEQHETPHGYYSCMVPPRCFCDGLRCRDYGTFAMACHEM